MINTVKEPIIAGVKIVKPDTLTLIDKTRDLVIRMQAQDLNAFTELYELTKNYVYYTIVKNGVTGEDVEDITQEVFTYIYKFIYEKNEKLKNPQGALKWIKRIAFGFSANYHKKSSRVHETLNYLEDDDSIFETDNQLTAPIEVPEDIMDNKETQRLIGEILEKLPKAQLDCVRAFYFSECKTKEIAEMYGIPEGTVKTNLSRARKTIEEEVRLLAKKHGTKLFALGAMPFFGSMFSMEASACKLGVASSKAILSNIININGGSTMGIKSMGTKAVSSAAKISTETVVKTGVSGVAKAGAATAVKAGAATAGKAIATKILVGALAVGGIGGGGVVVAHVVNTSNAETQSAIETPIAMSELTSDITAQINEAINDTSKEIIVVYEEKTEEIKAEENKKLQEIVNTPQMVKPGVNNTTNTEEDVPRKKVAPYIRKPEYADNDAFEAVYGPIENEFRANGGDLAGKAMWEIAPELFMPNPEYTP